MACFKWLIRICLVYALNIEFGCSRGNSNVEPHHMFYAEIKAKSISFKTLFPVFRAVCRGTKFIDLITQCTGQSNGNYVQDLIGNILCSFLNSGLPITYYIPTSLFIKSYVLPIFQHCWLISKHWPSIISDTSYPCPRGRFEKWDSLVKSW